MIGLIFSPFSTKEQIKNGKQPFSRVSHIYLSDSDLMLLEQLTAASYSPAAWWGKFDLAKSLAVHLPGAGNHLWGNKDEHSSTS